MRDYCAWCVNDEKADDTYRPENKCKWCPGRESPICLRAIRAAQTGRPQKPPTSGCSAFSDNVRKQRPLSDGKKSVVEPPFLGLNQYLRADVP